MNRNKFQKHLDHLKKEVVAIVWGGFVPPYCNFVALEPIFVTKNNIRKACKTSKAKTSNGLIRYTVNHSPDCPEKGISRITRNPTEDQILYAIATEEMNAVAMANI